MLKTQDFMFHSGWPAEKRGKLESSGEVSVFAPIYHAHLGSYGAPMQVAWGQALPSCASVGLQMISTHERTLMSAAPLV